MSSIRNSAIWKRTAAVGVAVGLSAGAIGVAVGTGGSASSSPTVQQTGLAQPSFAGQSGAQSTQAQGTAPGGIGQMQAPPAGMGPDLAAAATALGSSEAEVQEAMAAGTTIAAQATTAGVDLDTVIAAMVTGETASVRAQVTAGTLTQDQADQITSGIEQRVTAFVNGEMPAPPQGGQMPGGQGTPPAMPQGTQAPGTAGTVQG